MTTTAVDDSKLDYQALIDLIQAEFDYTRSHVSTMRLGEGYRTGFGGWLIVNTLSYGNAVSMESVIAHEAPVLEAILTEDGRMVNLDEWDDGRLPLDGESQSVYVERWTPEGRMFHGYVDSVSRKVVQTG
jgi:hypothetical protein